MGSWVNSSRTHKWRLFNMFSLDARHPSGEFFSDWPLVRISSTILEENSPRHLVFVERLPRLKTGLIQSDKDYWNIKWKWHQRLDYANRAQAIAIEIVSRRWRLKTSWFSRFQEYRNILVLYIKAEFLSIYYCSSLRRLRCF